MAERPGVVYTDFQRPRISISIAARNVPSWRLSNCLSSGMTITINLFFMVLALVLLLLAGVNCPAPPRLNLGWLGMFFWLLATVVKL